MSESLSRDPRTDPRPKDVLRGDPFDCRIFTVLDCDDYGCIVNQSPPFRPRRVFIPAAYWLKWAATATVVRRAENPHAYATLSAEPEAKRG